MLLVKPAAETHVCSGVTGAAEVYFAGTVICFKHEKVTLLRASQQWRRFQL